MRNESRSATQIWLASCICGTAAAITTSVPFFACSYGLAGCVIWALVYFVGACITGSIFLMNNREGGQVGPDALALCVAMVVGALLTSLIAATPFFICSFALVGCIAWIAAFVGGFIYTSCIFMPRRRF